MEDKIIVVYDNKKYKMDRRKLPIFTHFWLGWLCDCSIEKQIEFLKQDGYDVIEGDISNEKNIYRSL